MARRTRRTRTSSKKFITWQRVIIVVAPVLALFLLINNSTGRSVLGLTDTNFFNLGKKQASDSGKKNIPRPTCNRVTSFSAITICESNSKEKSNNSFSSYSYSCENGTSGNVLQKEGVCMPISKAYELAKKACHKSCITPKPTRPPKPTETESNL